MKNLLITLLLSLTLSLSAQWSPFGLQGKPIYSMAANSSHIFESSDSVYMDTMLLSPSSLPPINSKNISASNEIIISSGPTLKYILTNYIYQGWKYTTTYININSVLAIDNELFFGNNNTLYNGKISNSSSSISTLMRNVNVSCLSKYPNPLKIVVGTTTGIFIVDKNGTSSPIRTDSFKISSPTLPSPKFLASKSNDLYMATSNDVYHYVGGSTWEKVFRNSNINFLYTKDSSIYVGTNSGLFVSNNGINWSKIYNNNLLSMVIKNDTIYIGTTNGVYVSTLDKLSKLDNIRTCEARFSLDTSGVDSFRAVITDKSLFYPGFGSNDSATYIWNFGDGTIDTNKCPLHTYSYLSIGNYTITLTLFFTDKLNHLNFYKDTFSLNINIDTLGGFHKTTKNGGSLKVVPNGINNSSDKVLLSVYPNPAIDNVTILTDGDVFIRIFDSKGTFIKEYTEKNIDVSEYTNGVYILFIETNNKVITKKLIIKK